MIDVKVSVIPNRLEKHVDFTINSNLVPIDITQFMNFSFNTLVKNFSEMDFSYLSQ